MILFYTCIFEFFESNLSTYRLIFSVKEFTIALLGVIFVALIACSIQSISADHLEPGEGIFKNENQVNVISSKDSKYEIHLLVEHRNAQDQLISISEITHGEHIAHEITDFTFNERLGKKEIITIDNIKYEKVQYIDQQEISQELSEFLATWFIQLCGNEIAGHLDVCMPVFQVGGASIELDKGDVIKNQWTILRELN